ncbi:MAG: diacylglycerol kinase [Micrococcales bacterium]|nr:diacylglycerol kinase [Micrococcales bacterium]
MPTSQRLVVAINPSASFGARAAVGPAVVQTLRAAGHDVVSLTEPDFLSLVASARRALERRPDALVVVGGDGMVNLGVNLVARTRIPLGLVPSGTGNDAARALGIPHQNTEQAVTRLLEALWHPPRTIDAALMRWMDADTGRPEERWYLAMLSAGFDAIVNERANRMRHPKGAGRYILAMLAELARMRPLHYRLTLDGEVLETDALLAAVGNGPSLGGGMRLAPEALLDDGLLEVAIVRPMSRAGFLRLFPSVYRGTHVRDPRVEIRRAARVRIEATVVAYADGERVAPLPIEVEIVSGAVRVLSGDRRP